MTVRASKQGIKLREELASLRKQLCVRQQTFWFSGDSSQTDFPLPRGWKPVNVFVDGSIYRPGSGEDYTISYDGFIYTVVMAVAPASVDVGIICEREV